MKQVKWNFYSCSLRKKYENSLDFVKATIDATTGADHLEIMDALQTYREMCFDRPHFICFASLLKTQ